MAPLGTYQAAEAVMGTRLDADGYFYAFFLHEGDEYNSPAHTTDERAIADMYRMQEQLCYELRIQNVHIACVGVMEAAA